MPTETERLMMNFICRLANSQRNHAIQLLFNHLSNFLLNRNHQIVWLCGSSDAYGDR